MASGSSGPMHNHNNGLTGFAAVISSVAAHDSKDVGRTSLNWIYVNHLNSEMKKVLNTMLHVDVRIRGGSINR
jgi:hypothetical protein